MLSRLFARSARVVRSLTLGALFAASLAAPVAATSAPLSVAATSHSSIVRVSPKGDCGGGGIPCIVTSL